jgi:DNA polymerase-3 subunit epsilon
MTVNNVCIIDLETTNLDHQKDEVAEIGTILYSVKYQTVLQQYSTVIPVKENPQESINKISVEASQSLLKYDGELGRSDIFVPVFGMVQKSEYLIAHNANFDKQWRLVSHFDKPWLCTYEDFIWPLNSKPSNLITTALNHGIGVTKAHRALPDCQLIAELFDRADNLQGLFERAIARANEPRYLVIAQVSFDQKDLAKSAGFYWQPDGKLWAKELRESDLNVESSQWQFKFTTEIKND